MEDRLDHGTEKWGEGSYPEGTVGNEVLNEVEVIVPDENYLAPSWCFLIHLQGQEHEVRRCLRAFDDRCGPRHRMSFYVDGQSGGDGASDYHESTGNVTEDSGDYQTSLLNVLVVCARQDVEPDGKTDQV